MKNIWFFNHYATKEDEPATRTYDFSRELTRRGYNITIFASSFSHYKLEEKYLKDGQGHKTEHCEGVKFIWIKTFPYKKNDWRRALNMLSYGWRVFWLSLKIKEKPDVIIGTSIHPFAALSGFFVSKVKKSRFFLEITDIWPEMLIDMGLIPRRSFRGLFLKVVSHYLYRKSETIIIFPPYVKEYLISLGVSKNKITWIPNGVNFSRFKDVVPYSGKKGDNFVFMYTGIHSPYADLGTVLKAASTLQRDGIENVKFIFVGDGTEKKNLIKLSKILDLNNVEFRDMVPKKEIARVFTEADFFISIIKDIVVKYGVSSNKLNDYLAAGRPIIFAVRSKNNPVEEAGAGITISPQDAEVFSEAVKKMINLTEEKRIEMGQNGRKYAEKFLDIKLLTHKLEELINSK
ncbi:MAG: glycosyltransferase family 4 protein [Candidatus Paceibacterota bacterium]|jgi:glycosyltransferase involved in cell wall biosynthesis